MSVLAPSAAEAGSPVENRRPRFGLHGLAWLVWRRHRASFRLWMFCSVVLTGYLVYWHVKYHATFITDTFVGLNSTFGLPPDVGLSAAAFLLLAVPFLAAVVFGAQLFERPFTDGTVKLICTQSAGTAAWVRTELAVSAGMVVLCVGPCAAAFTWDYRIDDILQEHWHGIWVFDAVGPAALGVCLVGLFLGAASGLAWRSSAPAKSLALVLLIAFETALSWVLPHLLPSQLLVDGPGSAGQAQVPVNAWVLTTGELSSTESYTRYLPSSDLQPLQWLAGGVCLLVCAALTFVCLRLVGLRRG
jgi:hypothetical protein